MNTYYLEDTPFVVDDCQKCYGDGTGHGYGSLEHNSCNGVHEDAFMGHCRAANEDQIDFVNVNRGTGYGDGDKRPIWHVTYDDGWNAVHLSTMVSINLDDYVVWNVTREFER